jgi:Flp pilus assembly pilin Flp
MRIAIRTLGRLTDRFRDPGEEHAQTLIEYALIISFVAIVLITGLQFLQGGLVNSFQAFAAELAGISP